jgi:hypothetical protein
LLLRLPLFAEVYTFLRDAAGSFASAAINVQNAPASLGEFGVWVSVNAAGTTLAVGAPAENTIGGAVYMYTAAAGTGAWGAPQKLSGTSYGFTASRRFGQRVALNSAGTTLAVGSMFHSAAQGGIIVFILSGGTWITQSPILIPASMSGTAWVGSSLAINAAGDWIATGGPQDTAQGAITGAVFTYKRDGSGVWSFGQKLLPSDSTTASNRYFGIAVALSSSGTTLIIGADREGSTGAWWSVGRRSGRHACIHTASQQQAAENAHTPLLRSCILVCQAL